jgi:hypothetical protein
MIVASLASCHPSPISCSLHPLLPTACLDYSIHVVALAHHNYLLLHHRLGRPHASDLDTISSDMSPQPVATPSNPPPDGWWHHRPRCAGALVEYAPIGHALWMGLTRIGHAWRQCDSICGCCRRRSPLTSSCYFHSVPWSHPRRHHSLGSSRHSYYFPYYILPPLFLFLCSCDSYALLSILHFA